MDDGFQLISTLTLLGAAQGVFLALALLNTRGGNGRARRLLALLTLIFAADLAEEFLYQSGFFASFPDLLHVLAPIDLLYGPLIYLYVCQLTQPREPARTRTNYWHFLPALIGIVVLVPFYLMDGTDKLELTETLRKGGEMDLDAAHARLMETGLTLFVLGTIAQIGLYLALSIKALHAHSVRIRNQFSDIDRINLVWLRNLLLGLGCIFLLHLGDQFFPNLMGINILGDLITVIVVILIYTMGYLGLRQPAIFNDRGESSQFRSEVAIDALSDKYRKSGLDDESSQMFLNELTRHMEEQKPYLEGDLVLPQLAQQLGISANYLSQIINQQLKVNFYDFVNRYRVEEAKRLIRDARPEHVNILNVALDSGFNSKSAFYTAFKKTTAMTPSQYRRTVNAPNTSVV